MNTIHDINAEWMLQLLHETCAFIRSHDASYDDSVLRQAARIEESINNLTRYANIIAERMNNGSQNNPISTGKTTKRTV